MGSDSAAEGAFSIPNYPWPDFSRGSGDQAAEVWLSRHPRLAAEGSGVDPEYVAWYGRMLEATGTTGLIAAACYWEAPPAYMYLSYGPPGLERYPLPPPGRAVDNP